MKATYNKENKIYTDKVSNQLLNGGSIVEDKHIQLDQDKSLYHLDLILRTNDQGKYVAFDLFDNEKQEIIFTKKLKEVA